jgi:hypothetical protein
MYPKELYRNNWYRVVFSGEEERQFVALGWSETKNPDQKYVVYHSGIPEDVAGAPAAATADEPDTASERPKRRGRPASEPEA